ncbi:hypothetical protein [Sagittula salina]|uniref:Lipoprotein n=1 Tax=Sagittula salina TaxID=2820268 RepID=A0A940MM40_9RHOB|nr:hypothetical protein [Sagittula salina]MBP0481216.1 hypothetical protein [Sagittula salina]
MVSSSKILTVSYGTFSCTAEGFEDPLAVVKETTHFFRSVVSNDRFFGAEPPQFDADLATEMMRNHLARTQGDEGKLTLGTGKPNAASSGALAAALAAGPGRAGENTMAGETSDLLPDDDTIEATAIVTERPVDLDAAGSVADLTATDAPARTDAPAAPARADSALPDAARPEPASVPDAASMGAQHAAARAPATDPNSAVSTAIPDPADRTSAVEDVAPAPRPSNPDSVAAKLDRIRAVVAAKAMDTPAAAQTRPATATSVVAIAATGESLFDNEPGDEVDDEALSALLGELEAGDTGHGFERTAAQGASVAEAFSDTALSDSIASLMAREDAPEDVAAPGDTAPDTAPDTAMDNAVDDLLAAFDETDDEDDIADEFYGEEGDGFDGVAEAASPHTEAAVGSEDDHEAHPAADDNMFAEPAYAEDAVTGSTPSVDAETDEDGFGEPETDLSPEPSAAPRARVLKVKRADFLRAVEQGQLEEYDDDEEADAAQTATAPLPLADESTLSPEEEEELARELAAVKAELSGEFDSWADEETGEPWSASEPQPATALAEEDADHDRSDAAEQRETEDARARAIADGWGDPDSYLDDDEDFDDLADPMPLRLDNPVVPAHTAMAKDDTTTAQDDGDEDLHDDPVEAMIRDSARKTVKMASPARALLTEREVKDDDTSRLMDQTDTEMDEPEGNRRRTAIAHLRAAVAATKADRLLGRKADAAEEQEPYREDLANVVRPRRPQAPASAARTERPTAAASRPAPLKLVAAQRVASPTPAPSDLPRTVPVRPRRVQRIADIAPRVATPVAVDPAIDGFVAYAEQVGASELPELLEAAAAYMAYVEGRDQFSRPQLMSTVRLAEAQESSREDRLRSFGQLLREGKIKKTAGGRFTASERISFKPDRAAG